MGRAIVRQPSVFLMDEPLSNLDAKLRVQMRAEIASLQDRLGVTTIYVTHDQVEAMTMGDRVALLKDGVLQQVATPTEIYNNPANLFVAAFIGAPTMNLYWAELANGESGNARLKLGSKQLNLSASLLEARPGLGRYVGRRLVVGIRPEDIEDASGMPAGDTPAAIEARVELVEALGSDLIVHLGVDAQPAEVKSTDSLQEIKATQAKARCIARFSARSQVKLHQTLRVLFDTGRMHFFNGETGQAISG
jgi:multiple sugar transport system ATP-binding protein